MDLDEFKEMIAKCDAEEFCQEQLLQPQCWLFDESGLDEASSNYQEFREVIGSVIEVDAAEIRLVGAQGSASV